MVANFWDLDLPGTIKIKIMKKSKITKRMKKNNSKNKTSGKYKKENNVCSGCNQVDCSCQGGGYSGDAENYCGGY